VEADALEVRPLEQRLDAVLGVVQGRGGASSQRTFIGPVLDCKGVFVCTVPSAV
jgi:hypothetical protein